MLRRQQSARPIADPTRFLAGKINDTPRQDWSRGTSARLFGQGRYEDSGARNKDVAAAVARRQERH